ASASIRAHVASMVPRHFASPASASRQDPITWSLGTLANARNAPRRPGTAHAPRPRATVALFLASALHPRHPRKRQQKPGPWRWQRGGWQECDIPTDVRGHGLATRANATIPASTQLHQGG